MLGKNSGIDIYKFVFARSANVVFAVNMEDDEPLFHAFLLGY